jgi:hypothetical protein
VPQSGTACTKPGSLPSDEKVPKNSQRSKAEATDRFAAPHLGKVALRPLLEAESILINIESAPWTDAKERGPEFPASNTCMITP